MNLIADLHCHTIASAHAYSTLRENLDAAKRLHLCALAVTDHGPGCPDGPPLSYFENLSSLPEKIERLRLLRGAEANIMDYEGNLDIPVPVLEAMDLVIASFHPVCVKGGTVDQNTKAYLSIAENPHVDIIGHSGTPEYAFDYEKVIPVFKRYGKIVEINAHSFICRQSSIANCRRIAELCMKYETPIAINSDAHSEFELGQFDKALAMLEEINFPEELVVNACKERLNTFLESHFLQGVC